MSEESIPIMETAYDASRAEADLAYIVQQRKIIDWYEIQIGQANEKIQKAEARLKAFGISYRQTTGGALVSLSNGYITVKRARAHTVVDDPRTFRMWTELKYPLDVNPELYDLELNESRVKNLMTIRDGKFFTMDGAEVPGIRRVVPGEHDYNVKINAGRNITEEQSDDDNE